MVKDVKVVITLVGPYARYGNKLIKSLVSSSW